jgi:hypothetical protein
MGYDTSYHPVDLALVEERLLPYVKGRGEIDDLVARAVRIGRVRFRANAWGLGALATQDPAIQSMLHVWGRPFFITVEGPDAIGAAIDRYLAADPGDVDAIAREMLVALSPGLAARAEPSTSGTLPADADAAKGFRFRLDLMRAAYERLDSGEPVRTPDGDEHEPRSLLARELPLSILEFAAHFRPGWMDRGIWPTMLLEAAGVPAEILGDWFRPPRPLVGDVEERVRCFLEPSIRENYMVGGMIEAPTVGRVRGVLENNIEKVGEESRGSVRKMIEALADAERRGLAFVEATEVYSGIGGTMN